MVQRQLGQHMQRNLVRGQVRQVHTRLHRHQPQILQERLRPFRIEQQRLGRQLDAQPAVDRRIARIPCAQQPDQVAREARLGQRQRPQPENHHPVGGQRMRLRVERMQNLREQQPVQRPRGALCGRRLLQPGQRQQLPMLAQQARQYRHRAHRHIRAQRRDCLRVQPDLCLRQLLPQLVPELARRIRIGQCRTVGHHRIRMRCAFRPRQLAGQPGRLDQPLGIQSAHCLHRPDGYGQRNRHPLILHRRAAQQIQQQRGLRTCQRQLVARQYQQELVAAHPAHCGGGRHLAVQMLGHRLQHRITRRTAEHPVDAGKPLDVHVHAAQRTAAAQLAQMAVQHPAQAHQVGQPRQLVALGNLLEGGRPPGMRRHLVHAHLEAVGLAHARFHHPHPLLAPA